MLSQAAGSAYVEFGNTKVMAGVCAPIPDIFAVTLHSVHVPKIARKTLSVLLLRYGPRESDRREAFSDEGRLQCDVKIATFATRQRGNFGQARSAAAPVEVRQPILSRVPAASSVAACILVVYVHSTLFLLNQLCVWCRAPLCCRKSSKTRRASWLHQIEIRLTPTRWSRLELQCWTER